MFTVCLVSMDRTLCAVCFCIEGNNTVQYNHFLSLPTARDDLMSFRTGYGVFETLKVFTVYV